MRRHITKFEALFLENKKAILSDPEALDRIERRLEERSVQKNKKEQPKAEQY
ncbi:FbpB family small basic protein [bacterium LRH843]|nr:FbpB family small basic protein [bacterium LRH843]